MPVPTKIDVRRALTDTPLARLHEHELLTGKVRKRPRITWTSFHRSRYPKAALALALDAQKKLALGEYGAIDLFARMAAGLSLNGAPFDLVAAATRVIADECRHAEYCLRMASLCGRTRGVRARRYARVRRCSRRRPLGFEELDAFMLEVAAIGETLAAALLAACQRRAQGSNCGARFSPPSWVTRSTTRGSVGTTLRGAHLNGRKRRSSARRTVRVSWSWASRRNSGRAATRRRRAAKPRARSAYSIPFHSVTSCARHGRRDRAGARRSRTGGIPRMAHSQARRKIAASPSARWPRRSVSPPGASSRERGRALTMARAPRKLAARPGGARRDAVRLALRRWPPPWVLGLGRGFTWSPTGARLLAIAFRRPIAGAPRFGAQSRGGSSFLSPQRARAR